MLPAPPASEGSCSSAALGTCSSCIRSGCEFCSSPYVSGEPQPGGTCMLPDDSAVMTLEADKGCNPGTNATTYLYKARAPPGPLEPTRRRLPCGRRGARAGRR